MQEVDISLEQYTGKHISPQILSKPLSDAAAAEIIDHLKQEADRYWFIDSERSLDFADRIIAIGKARNDLSQEALGWMARGDALRFSGRMEESWDTLVRAGVMFETAGDEVGWARTRIGRLYLAMKLNRVEETLLDGREAQKILKCHCEDELLVRLNKARAIVYDSLGYAYRALRLFQSSLTIATKLGKLGEQHLGVLNMDIGATLENLGDYSQALNYYERAQAIFKSRGEIRNIALIELNIAYIAQAQGHYRHALHLLHGILGRGVDRFPMEYLAVKRLMTECYLQLNRYPDARSLAEEVIFGYRSYNAAYETARSLLNLATADGELGNFPAADIALLEAENIFTNLGATSWLATIHLNRGRIALKHGNVKKAFQEALAAETKYDSVGQQINQANALLLKGQTLFARKDFELAAKAGNTTLRISQQFNVPSLRYASHLLLGNIAEAQQRNARAIRRYQAATFTIERVQRGLTITLRSGFLEDKGEASRALIALYLRSGQVKNAFETLEHSKAQVLLGYLLNREQLRWAKENSRNRALIDELNQLRAEHQWFYRLAHDPPKSDEHPSFVSPEQALIEVNSRERRMRSITEQLYLHSGHEQQINPVPKTVLFDIQRSLNQDTLLLEYYNDGTHIWAFTLDQETAEVHRLPIAIGKLNPLLSQLQTNINAALNFSSHSPSSQSLSQLAKRVLKRLYKLLIEPLSLNSRKLKRLVIVPYGALHFLPFHLLYDGSEYLIERQEVVILPTASLITRAAPRRDQGALILAHSNEDQLPHTLEEARTVQQLCGGALYINEAANRKTLRTLPTQILHIAAHGQHRLDQPDLSYLQLADGQLYADDLMQQDLSYELVTLSGCETGRANVAARDELIGLGRGVLYAGAGALLVSQWRVADASTLDFMKKMYASLLDGVSKAAALRNVQRSILAANREIHPAYWGAFQLIGNADPLSIYQ
jgi:CHAT domain-containing protein